MSDLVIREYRKEDIPALSALWLEVFDEKREFVEAFFASLPDMGSGMLAELDGKIVGAGYTLNGQELISGNAKPPVVGYIYGIAVLPEYRGRGIGVAVTKAVAELSGKREAKIICCEPAEPSLVAWYEKVLGLRPALYRRYLSVKAEKLEMSMPLSSTEYMIWRENMLTGKPHIHLSNYALEFEKKMLNIYGGGFIAVESGIAAAYMVGDTALVRELICPPGLEERCAASVAAAMGAKEARLCLPSSEGEVCILSDKALPAGCIWNLSFN